MRKSIIIASLTLVIFVLSLTLAFACGCCEAKVPAKPPAVKTISAVCPVMGNKIPDITKAAGKSVYKGKTYYFCCSGCKPIFDKNPAKYAKK